MICSCGCGETTPIATYTHRARGIVKGNPLVRIPYHGRAKIEPIEQRGLCFCGCGERTGIADRRSVPQQTERGQAYRYIRGHQRRKSAVAWVEEDRGYATPCHIWKRCLNNKGYGVTTFEGKRIYAHILAFTQKYGPVPPGKELDHKCRVQACRNPEHLEAVTHAQNLKRGKVVKFSGEQIAAIRDSDPDLLHTEVAAQFGVEASYVCRIRNGYVRKVDACGA